MNFGKSKAKFQMEPNTGITFADVAGVEEAKQDFMEASFSLPDMSAGYAHNLPVLRIFIIDQMLFKCTPT